MEGGTIEVYRIQVSPTFTPGADALTLPVRRVLVFKTEIEDPRELRPSLWEMVPQRNVLYILTLGFPKPKSWNTILSP